MCLGPDAELVSPTETIFGFLRTSSKEVKLYSLSAKQCLLKGLS